MMRGLDRGEKPALLISECQNGLIDPAYADSPLIRQCAARGIIPKIAALAEAFRAAGAPVIHCTIVPPANWDGFVVNSVLLARMRKEDRVVAGRVEAEIHNDLRPGPKDIVIERRHGVSPFHGTELEAVLRGLGVDTVVLSGVSTNVALVGAVIEATNRYFNAVLVEDCTAGGTPETHAMQIAMYFPLLATVAGSEAVVEAIARRAWAR